MTSRMVGSVLTLMTLLFSAGVAGGQTYTQMQWGMNKATTPYQFGANINGAWSNLGSVNSAGVWTLSPNSMSVSNGILAPYTGNFYTNLGPVNNQLFGGRQFLGKATNYDGSNNPAGIFANIPQWLLIGSQTVSFSQNGSLALTGLARTSDAGTTRTNAIGISGLAVADTSNFFQRAWGGYLEAYKPNGGTNQIFGLEINAGNNDSNVSNNPYALYGGGAIGLDVAAGGSIANGAPGFYVYPSTAAILVANNTQSWNTGLLFDANSISGTDGVTGTGNAIALAKGHTIQWFTPAGFTGAIISSSVADTSKKVSLGLGENVVSFSGANGAFTTTIENVTNSVNYFRLIAQSTGNSPTILAGGSDTNINLTLAAKGTGTIAMSSPVKLPSYTFATLPTCGAGTTGALIYVSDSNSATFNATITGSGANKVMGLCDGTNWTVH